MPARERSPIGAHVFVGGGLVRRGLPYAEQIGAESMQVFVSNPRGWAQSAGDAAIDEAFRSCCADRGMPVFVHAPYLCNLASPDEEVGRRSVAAITHSVSRGRRIGARGVVVHTGSVTDGRGRAAALEVVRERLLPVLDALGDEDPMLLVEPTAGAGQPVASKMPDLAPLFAVLESHPRLGVAFDACHAFAAGHDLAAPGGMTRTLDALVAAVGPGRLRLVHANDSRDPLGSGRDRHTNVGSGSIGLAPFGELFSHPAVTGVPVVVETPGDADVHAQELATLRALRDAVR